MTLFIVKIMDIKKYFETIFDIDIVDEINLNWNGIDDLIVIRRLDGGKNTTEIKTQPFQLQLYTQNALEGKRLFDDFINIYNNIVIYRDLEIIIPNYFPPVVIPNINAQGNGYYYQVVMSGIFQISANVDDIKTIKIDGYEVLTEDRNIQYITSSDTQPKSIKSFDVETKNQNKQIQINLVLNSVNSALSQKLKSLRTSEIDINTLFNVELIHTNDEIETYDLVCLSHSINSKNGAFPTISINLGE